MHRREQRHASGRAASGVRARRGGGLVYAALQFRGWRTAQYVANFTTLVELQLQLRKIVVEEPTLATLGAGMPPGLLPDEIRGDFYNLM